MKQNVNLSFTTMVVALASLLALAGCSTPASKPQRSDLESTKQRQLAATPAEVLEKLKRGNERFAAGKPETRDMLHDQRTTAAGQYP